MSIIESAKSAPGHAAHGIEHGAAGAGHVLASPLHAFQNMSPKGKLFLVGGIIVGGVAFWWIFLRNSGIGSANGSSTSATPTGTGVSDSGTPVSGPQGAMGPAGPAGPRGPQGKPGKNGAKTNKSGSVHHKHGHNKFWEKLVPPLNGPQNGQTIPHPVPSHRHPPGLVQRPVSKNQFLQALGLVRKDRATLRQERATRSEALKNHQYKYAKRLRSRIRGNRLAVEKQRNVIIRYRHPNKPNYLIHIPGTRGKRTNRPVMNHAIPGRRKGKRTAA